MKILIRSNIKKTVSNSYQEKDTIYQVPRCFLQCLAVPKIIAQKQEKVK